MQKVSVVAVGLGMIAVGLLLILLSSTVQAKNDTGYLGMGEWRPTVTEAEDTC
jgi:hypothetical protein